MWLMLAVPIVHPTPHPPKPDCTQTEQSEEKTNPGPNKYMKVWFN